MVKNMLERVIRSAATICDKGRGNWGPYCTNCQSYGHTTPYCPFADE